MNDKRRTMNCGGRRAESPPTALGGTLRRQDGSYIGDAVGKGWRRVLVNVILVLALSMATIGSLIQIKNRVINKLWPAQTNEQVEQKG